MRANVDNVIIYNNEIQAVDLLRDGGNVYINLQDLTNLFNLYLNFEGKIPVIEQTGKADFKI